MMSVSIAGKTTKPGSSVSQASEVLYLRTVYTMGSLHQTDAARFRGGDIMLPVSQTRLDYLSATDPFASGPTASRPNPRPCARAKYLPGQNRGDLGTVYVSKPAGSAPLRLIAAAKLPKPNLRTSWVPWLYHHQLPSRVVQGLSTARRHFQVSFLSSIQLPTGLSKATVAFKDLIAIKPSVTDPLATTSTKTTS